MDLARSYKIYVDGKKIGEIYDDEIKEFDITPGQHIIKAKVELFSSKPVNIKLEDEQATLQMFVKNNTSMWFFLFIFLLGSFLGNSIFKLLFDNDGFMRFVILVITITLVMWLYYKITPYLKLEPVDKTKKS